MFKRQMEKNKAIVVDGIWKSYISGGIGSRTLIGDIKSAVKNGVRLRSSIRKILDKESLTTAAAKRNERFWVLKDINFTIEKGEIVAILGRNGAGKSTLLRIISQITEADKGEIAYRGKMTSLLGAGIGFNPEMTGRENIFLNGSILGMKPKEIQDRLDVIIDFSEIPQFIDTPLKRYSDGMKARLGFSVAIHLDAQIMVFDEVFMTGDRTYISKCIDKVSEIAKSGKTILVVTHFPQLLNDVCRRGITLKNGCVVFDGDIDSAIQTYLSE